MEIEQVIKISQLYDFYSELLSDKQKQYLNDYYFNDLSLTEISENYNISKQAVSSQSPLLANGINFLLGYLSCNPSYKDRAHSESNRYQISKSTKLSSINFLNDSGY